MSIVTDANLLIALAVDDARAPAVTAQLDRWTATGEDLHAPALLPYEVANGLTRLVATSAFPAERVVEAWETVMALPITYHPLREDGDEVVAIAMQLGRKNAYDATYLALARDGPLAQRQRARVPGLPPRLAFGHGFLPGSQIVKALPCPGILSTLIRPPGPGKAVCWWQG